MKLLYIAIGLSFVISISARRFIRDQGTQQKTFCYTPLGDRGLCVSLKNCPQVVNLFTQLPESRAKQYSIALQNICGRQITSDNYPVLCCSRIVLDPSEVKELTTAPTVVTDKVKSSSSTSATKSPPTVAQQPPGSKDCRGPDHENGFCQPLEYCSKLLDSLKKNPSNESFNAYLRTSNRICGSSGTDVCCPNDVPTRVSAERLPTEDDGCGVVKGNLPKVVGGSDSQIGAWPWITLIGYNRYSLNPFRCGGTLVTAKCVITAAHCITKDLSFVRLGEFDLSIETETPHVDIDVERMLAHTDFAKDFRNDIGVLYLEKIVEFSELISPICLPLSSELRSKSYVGWTPFVAGWGRTSYGGTTSNILRQLQMPIRENSVCRNVYRAHNKLLSEEQFDESVLCAGGVPGEDTCQGDSGGPLMIPEPYKGFTRFYLIGIVSYGIQCGVMGVPGGYTKTQHFMDWIVDRISEA